MIQRTYESVVIVNAALEDDQIEVTLKKIEDNIQANGGSILDADKWGRKRLAYPIQKSKSGYYAVYRFEAPSELIAKLERHYQLDETIVRYLTIKKKKKTYAFKAIFCFIIKLSKTIRTNNFYIYECHPSSSLLFRFNIAQNLLIFL